MIYPVKYFHSQMRGAPTVSGLAGSLIGMLNACLLTGFGLTTVTGISVSGGVATATVGAGNSFEEGAVVLMDGDMPAELKGEVRALTSASASFSYATAAADGTYTGSFTAKYAPVGQWEKAFSGANLAAYRSVDPESNGHYLRVDDTLAQKVRLRGFESMTDVNTGTGPFPTDTQMSGGGWLWKSLNVNSVPVRWKVFADSRYFIFCVAPGYSSSVGQTPAPARAFGDPISLAPGGDGFGTVLHVTEDSVNDFNRGALDRHGLLSANNQNLICSPRAPVGLGGAVLTNAISSPGSINFWSGNDPFFGSFPPSANGALLLARAFYDTGGRGQPRSMAPGFYYIPQTNVASFVDDGDVLMGAGELAGRRLIAVRTANAPAAWANTLGVYLVDATGPWR